MRHCKHCGRGVRHPHNSTCPYATLTNKASSIKPNVNKAPKPTQPSKRGGAST